MIYSPGNAAKQWILDEVARIISDRPVRLLDLACGNGLMWDRFSADHPNLTVVAVDVDAAAIEEGAARLAGRANISFRVFDAQQPFHEEPFDIITAMSTIEHVVDRVAFVKTVWDALTPGGIAFLNYDVGHFRSRRVRERIMAPVSQLLARIGIEGPYMKKVDDDAFIRLLERQGFYIVRDMKQNTICLKGRMRQGGDDAVRLWVDFETKLNTLMRPAELDPIMLSTTIVVRKP